MFFRSLKHFAIITCWRCERELDNVYEGVVYMRKGNEQITVCGTCAKELEKQGWVEVARQK